MFRIFVQSTVVATCLALAAFEADSLDADIVASDIMAVHRTVAGSGNGTLDLRLFTFSGSEIQNAWGGFNGDNGNNTLPQGGGADTGSFVESYVTTMGELQAFYALNFPDGMGGSNVREITLFVDLDESGQAAQATNLLDHVELVLNPAFIQGNPDPLGDVTSAEQAAIDQIHSGGTSLTSLIHGFNLPIVAQGAGHADYAIFTGIDPYAYDPADVILFNVSMSALNNGSDEVFLSGVYAATDVTAIPEPSLPAFLGILGGIGAWLLPRHRRAL
jgi:hypothetical protein